MIKNKYTIHQHNAKRAGPHFDIRLEKGNEVHSFALPKNKLPDEKHVYLAIKTHVNYNDTSILDFYGQIPYGQYGAGDVIVFDQGYYNIIDWPSDSNKIIFEVPYQNGGQALFGIYYFVKIKENQFIFGKKK